MYVLLGDDPLFHLILCNRNDLRIIRFAKFKAHTTIPQNENYKVCLFGTS